MALKDPETQAYYRITGFNLIQNHIYYTIYKDEAHRNSGDTGFLKAKERFCDVADIKALLKVDPTLDTKVYDNAMTKLYEAMSALEKFNVLTGC